MSSSLCAAWAPRVLSLLRFMSALVLLQHGTAKILGFPAIPNFANISLTSLLGASGLIELIGGALLAIGLFTRPVAFILSGFAAVAYFMAHASKSFFPIINGGEVAILMAFIYFYLSFAGGGSISVDAMLKKDN